MIDINTEVINVAMQVHDQFKAQYALVLDWKLPANQHRLFIVDYNTQQIVYSWWTSHGSNSGSKLIATTFSNRIGSLMSSKGLMKTGDTYYSSKHGFACRLIGLEEGVNDNVLKRDIVLHSASYVSEDYITENSYPGRSWGCITLDPEHYETVINMLKGGSPVINIT